MKEESPFCIVVGAVATQPSAGHSLNLQLRMISVVFIADSFDGPFSLPRVPAPAGAADRPGGRVAGHVQHGSPRDRQPGWLRWETQDDCKDSAHRHASAVSGQELWGRVFNGWCEAEGGREHAWVGGLQCETESGPLTRDWGNLARQCPAEFIQGHTVKVRVNSRVAEQGSGTVAFKCLWPGRLVKKFVFHGDRAHLDTHVTKIKTSKVKLTQLCLILPGISIIFLLH